MGITRIQHRRATSAAWREKNPLLLAGELGVETDTQRVKFGDGIHHWDDLSYAMEGLLGEIMSRLAALEDRQRREEGSEGVASDMEVEAMLEDVFSM